MELTSIEKICYTCPEGIYYHFDRYNLKQRTLFSTKEISFVIDFEHQTYRADCIAYGEYFEVEDFKERQSYYDFLKKENLITRDLK